MRYAVTVAAALALASGAAMTHPVATSAGSLPDQTDMTLVANSKTHAHSLNARRSHSREWLFLIAPDRLGTPHDLGG
jgi:hypothetical protein